MITVREYTEADLDRMVDIWNEVVEEGEAFPQTEFLDAKSGRDFFFQQTHTAAAVSEDGQVLGLYILHPNNIGRVGHIGNASYAVDRTLRGNHIGEALVRDCLKQAAAAGFRVLQFNAVVDSNLPARHLYQRLGFTDLGVIPGGFLMKDGHYEDIHVMYYDLMKVSS